MVFVENGSFLTPTKEEKPINVANLNELVKYYTDIDTKILFVTIQENILLLSCR